MELKAVPAKYEHASQLAKYKDELERRGENNILMWLVAPQVSNSVRQFLDGIGIEYSEIHSVQFQRVAERHGIKPVPEVSELPTTDGALHAGNGRQSPTARSSAAWVNSPYALKEDFDRNELHQLLTTFDSVVKREIDRSLSRRLRQELLYGTPAHMSRSATEQLAKWCNTHNPLYWDGMEVARKISLLLFGCVLDRNRLGV